MKKKIVNLLPFASCLLPLLNLLPFATCVLPILTATSANGQIIPDGTLPNNTIVAPNGQTLNIEGGTRSGGNLFHSFTEFNLGTGSTAFFNNAVDIENILSRVTGGNISNIDGLIRANGAASLFLVNPAGMVFGPNARLDIGGSFLASSAESVIFNDGSFYSATETEVPPLLTVKVPIGLQMGTNPGAIRVEGTGHKLSRDNDFAPVDRSEQLRAPAGLQLSPGNTLTIVGGDVTLDGGILTAYEGQIELGSIKGGNVKIEKNGNLGYENAELFKDILMVSRALLDTSSIPGSGSAGSIRIQGRHLEMRDGSIALIQNLGTQSAGNLSVNATESVILTGTTTDASIRSSLTHQTLGLGTSGDIVIYTPQLQVANGAALGTSAYGSTKGGNVNIQVSDSIEIIGASPFNPGAISAVATSTSGSGNAGKIEVSAARLRLVDGGVFSSTTLGAGAGGEVRVNARDFVELVGVESNTFVPSNLSVFSFQQGAAGNLTISAPQLIVRGGGRVGASAFGSGPAGNVTIDASSVTVSGTVPGSINPSLIDSSANIADEPLQQTAGLPAIPTGDAGNVTINTSLLTVAEGGLVGVQHEGTGNAGALRINAGSVLVESGGGITAASASGLGGEVFLNVGDSLLLRDGGRITAEAGGIGDGGNLTINAETLALFGNSNINANAFEGSGGNIRITAEGLFPSAESAITASSQLGVDGTVEVEGLDNQAKELGRLSNSLPDLTALIASGCEVYANSGFIITGRGGLRPNPMETMSNINPIIEWAPPEESLQSSQRLEVGSRYPKFNIPVGDRLVEATGWIRRPDGGIELVANMEDARSSWGQFPNCQNN